MPTRQGSRFRIDHLRTYAPYLEVLDCQTCLYLVAIMREQLDKLFPLGLGELVICPYDPDGSLTTDDTGGIIHRGVEPPCLDIVGFFNDRNEPRNRVFLGRSRSPRSGGCRIGCGLPSWCRRCGVWGEGEGLVIVRHGTEQLRHTIS